MTNSSCTVPDYKFNDLGCVYYTDRPRNKDAKKCAWLNQAALQEACAERNIFSAVEAAELDVKRLKEALVEWLEEEEEERCSGMPPSGSIIDSYVVVCATKKRKAAQATTSGALVTVHLLPPAVYRSNSA